MQLKLGVLRWKKELDFVLQIYKTFEQVVTSLSPYTTNQAQHTRLLNYQ